MHRVVAGTLHSPIRFQGIVMGSILAAVMAAGVFQCEGRTEERIARLAKMVALSKTAAEREALTTFGMCSVDIFSRDDDCEADAVAVAQLRGLSYREASDVIDHARFLADQPQSR